MKYNLVALFDNDSNKLIEVTQKNLCRKYKLHKVNQQQFFIPIQTVIDPDIDKFNKIVMDTLAPYKKFKVRIAPNICLDKSLKTVSLKIDTKGYIIRIARNISDTLSLSGFNIKPDYEKELHIALASSSYNLRKSLNQDEQTTAIDKIEDSSYNFAKITHLQLWKSVNNKKEMLVRDYPLREY
jgi:hypothetical protein